MNRQDVLDRAIETLDSYGFADLSMRRLATSLGVQPGALYWHFANKQTLLMAVAEVILQPVLTPEAGVQADEPSDGTPVDALATHDPGVASEGPPWAATVRVWATTLRDALLAHRDGAEVVASVLALRPRGLDPAVPCVTVLTGAGLSPAEATAAAAALVHYTVGHAVDAQNHAQARALGVREVAEQDDEAASATERFTFGLDVFLAGLALRVP